MQQTSKLPEGWAYSTLDTIGKWATGGTPSRKVKEYFGVDIPWIKSGDLNDSIVTDIEEKITKKGLDNCSAKLLPEGTISIALYGATIGKLGIFGKDATTNQACANCIPNNSIIHTKFLFYYLFQQRKTLIEAGQGGAQPNLTNRIVREWPLSLPPLAEQHRIVSAIEALFTRLDAANERLDRVPEIIKKFRQSVLAAACEGRLTEEWREGYNGADSPENLLQEILDGRMERFQKKVEEAQINGKNEPKPPTNLERQKIIYNSLFKIPLNWIWVTWDDLVDWITYGFTRPMPHVDNGIPIITAKNINNSKIHFNNFDYTTKEAFEKLSEKDRPIKGEILITKDGSIGRAALVETENLFCINQSVAVLRFGGLTANKSFLLKVIQSNFTQHLIEEKAKGTAIKHISITNFGKFPVPLPPLLEQHEIVRRVDALFALADSIEAKVTAAREKTDKLRQSILAKAFSGELVETEAKLARREGRDYEPADVLLERIKAEQGKSGKKGKAAKGKSAHRKE